MSYSSSPLREPSRYSGGSLSRMASAASAVMKTSWKPSSSHAQHSPYAALTSSMPLSGSAGFGFDKHALGDDLPSSAHAPEPERPVSRNATARANARERDRQRAHSTLGSRSSMSLFDYNRDQLEQQRMQREQDDAEKMYAHAAPAQQQQQHSNTPLLMRSPSRIRHDSSPALAGTWSTYASPSMAEMPPPAHIPLHRAPSQTSSHPFAPYGQAVNETYYPPHGHMPAQQAWPPQAEYVPPQNHIDYSQQQHAYMPPQQYSVPYSSSPLVSSPTQYGDAHWHVSGSEPLSQAMQSGAWASTPAGPHNGLAFPSTDMSPQNFSVYSPIASSPHSPMSHLHAWSAAPSAISDGGNSSASPSRSSSRSSTVSRAPSNVSSISSVSGTVRRALPQLPTPSHGDTTITAPSTPKRGEADGDCAPESSKATVTAATIEAASLSKTRHDSVRLAAEEIMARGSPRRRGMIPNSMREARDNSASPLRKFEGTVNGSEKKGSDERPECVRRERSENTEDLENAMQAMKVSEKSEDRNTASHQALRSMTAPTENAHHVMVLEKPIAQKEFIPRATSPRPVRAYPAPEPSVSIVTPFHEVVSHRPRSRGPKDDREEPRMMTMPLPIPPPMPIKSPPPDRRLPDVAYNDGLEQGQGNIPMITVGVADEEDPKGQGSSQPPHHHHHHHHSGVSKANGPAAASLPDCHQHRYSPPSEQTHASISISQSSSNVAQRSTTSMANTVTHSAHHLGGKPGMFGVAPAPVSASAVGSGASCSTCRKWISGRVVHAMSHNFHPDCFVCDHCGENLEHVAFYEHEGRAYCHFDYHELFSKRCFHCRTPIVDQRYITINDVELMGTKTVQPGQVQERCYHDMHFFCANCGDPFLDPKLASDAAGRDPLAETIEDENGTVRFGGRKFVVHKGYPYCEHCHVSLHKPKCKGCRQPIVDEEYLTALNAKWHVSCFCCDACKRPIEDDNFFVRDNVAYDEQCYKVKLRSEI